MLIHLSEKIFNSFFRPDVVSGRKGMAGIDAQANTPGTNIAHEFRDMLDFTSDAGSLASCVLQKDLHRVSFGGLQHCFNMSSDTGNGFLNRESSCRAGMQNSVAQSER